jgi:hypothetical protein
MLAYALVVAAVAAVVVHRVVSWEDDLRAARVDSIVGSRSGEVTDA